ncbi:hypothetical protein ABIE27_004051 [Paenibacillus sp. 4624]
MNTKKEIIRVRSRTISGVEKNIRAQYNTYSAF